MSNPSATAPGGGHELHLSPLACPAKARTGCSGWLLTAASMSPGVWGCSEPMVQSVCECGTWVRCVSIKACQAAEGRRGGGRGGGGTPRQGHSSACVLGVPTPWASANVQPLKMNVSPPHSTPRTAPPLSADRPAPPVLVPLTLVSLTLASLTKCPVMSAPPSCDLPLCPGISDAPTRLGVEAGTGGGWSPGQRR